MVRPLRNFSAAFPHPANSPVQARTRLVRGSALVETLIALVIVVLFLSGTYASNLRVWSLVRSSLESNSANRTLNGRAEQLRAATWDQAVDATYLHDTVLVVAPDAGGDIASLLETVDVITYPTPNVVPSVRVTRDNPTGTATIVGSGDGTMKLQTSARINLTATWTSKGGQSHTRQISMIFAPGGVSGRK